MEKKSEQNKENEPEDIYSNILYVADLPSETTNEDLANLFQEYNFQFANLKNCKNNMAWAQVNLKNSFWANKARHELNGYVLKPSNSSNIALYRPIRICKYEGRGPHRENNIKQSLLVKNIDINMTQKEFYNIFLKYGDIVSGKIEYDEKGVSKGFGYIYYYTEESAENAKKNLNGKCFFGKALEIVNLIPGRKNKSNNITLFVLNLPNDITEEKVREFFEKFGPISYISVKNKGYAYISYTNYDSASKCLNQMKTNPISFPGLPNVVVKNSISKEEREANRNFISNNLNKNNAVQPSLNIQFNYLYYNPEIKNDTDLDKEIRLFIKVIMLMDVSPKDVLVDLETMSGIAIFENYKDYNLFFNKYYEFCSKQPPPFECLPYDMSLMNDNEQDINQTPFPENMQFPISLNHEFNNFSKMQKENNFAPNNNMGMPVQNNANNNRNNYNPMKKSNRYQGNNNNMKYKNNNNNYDQYNNNKNRYGNKNNNNNNTNKKTIIQRPNIQNSNQKYIFRQNYGNSYNININMNQNMVPPPMNPFFHQPMMMYPNQNSQRFNNSGYNNMKNQFTPMNYHNNQNYIGMEQKNDFQENNDYNYRNDNDDQKNDIDLIDQRNLQNLNPSQLLSQFNKPPKILYGPNMLNSKEQEDLINEIADSIYEIVYAKYPNEASKITGMIKEKGYEKMNMLLSKQEDLNEIIDKAYEMIKNSRNNNKNDNEEK